MCAEQHLSCALESPWHKRLSVLRRLAAALRLLPGRFDLGFRALAAFCPAQTARLFAAVAAALAAQGRTAELRALLQNIQGIVTSDEWDQVWASIFIESANLDP